MRRGDSDADPRSRRAILETTGRAAVGFLGAFTGGTATSDRAAARQTVESRQFFGTAYTSLEFLDDDGNTVYAEEYENDVFVVLTPPITSGFQRETNRFHLRIDPSGPLIFSDDTETGEIQIESAYDYGTELVQFWSISMESTTEFRGSLTTATPGSPPERNWISVLIPGQGIVRRLPLSEGTTISAFIEDDTLFADIQGNTANRDTPFTVYIIAPRE